MFVLLLLIPYALLLVEFLIDLILADEDVFELFVFLHFLVHGVIVAVGTVNDILSMIRLVDVAYVDVHIVEVYLLNQVVDVGGRHIGSILGFWLGNLHFLFLLFLFSILIFELEIVWLLGLVLNLEVLHDLLLSLVCCLLLRLNSLASRLFLGWRTKLPCIQSRASLDVDLARRCSWTAVHTAHLILELLLLFLLKHHLILVELFDGLRVDFTVDVWAIEH